MLCLIINWTKKKKEQLKDELSAYNPLIPKGKELVATLMFEIDDPMLRADFLSKIGGIEEKIYMQVDKEIIKALLQKKNGGIFCRICNYSNNQLKKG